MSFPDAFVEEVRRTADIARYISEHGLYGVRGGRTG